MIIRCRRHCNLHAAVHAGRPMERSELSGDLAGGTRTDDAWGGTRGDHGMTKKIHTHGVSGPHGSERSYGIAPPAFRLPDTTHIGGVRVQVSDLVRSVAYYEQVIGLRVISAGDTTTLGAHRDDRALVTLQTSPGITHANRGAFGLYHFAILLPDRAALGRFAAHLSESGVRVGAADHL